MTRTSTFETQNGPLISTHDVCAHCMQAHKHTYNLSLSDRSFPSFTSPFLLLTYFLKMLDAFLPSNCLSSLGLSSLLQPHSSFLSLLFFPSSSSFYYDAARSSHLVFFFPLSSSCPPRPLSTHLDALHTYI